LNISQVNDLTINW